MGERPSVKFTIEKIDNDGNYEPGNCRWATMKEQNRNTRRNRRLTAHGETKAISAWAEDERCVASYSALIRRIDQGWEPELALSAPRSVKRHPNGHFTTNNPCTTEEPLL